jgi:hypothetical protein
MKWSNILRSSLTLAPDAPPMYDSAGNLNYEGYGPQNTNSRSAFPFSSLTGASSTGADFSNNKKYLFSVKRKLKYKVYFKCATN